MMDYELLINFDAIEDFAEQLEWPKEYGKKVADMSKAERKDWRRASMLLTLIRAIAKERYEETDDCPSSVFMSGLTVC